MTDANMQAFFDHAKSEMPRESCGVIIIQKGKERLIICKNKSLDPGQFVLDPADYARASMLGEVVSIVHSHVFIPPFPSEADKVACEATGIEWLICSVPTNSWFSFAPSGFKAPLIGREWSHGILDCLSIVQDYHKENFGIEIMDFDREEEWWDHGQNIINLENWEKAGFHQVPIEGLKKHDVLLMQVGSKVANHLGVYLGDDQLLHHLSRRLSSRDVYSGYYRKHTVKVLRYA